VVSVSWALVPIAYFIGTFPTAQVVGRLVGHDPTVEGSGNPGASNMTRLAGRWAGGLVLTGDVLKAVIPVAAGYAFGGRPLAVACGIAAVVGHIYPMQRRLRGGKGVAAFVGVSIVLWPLVGLTALVTWFVAVNITRRASVGSMVTTVVVVAGVAVSGRPLWEVAAVGGLAALVLLRHWSNLVRLVQRQEASI
jgi:acyl phosphate:glycerol-3-phosphate acyltransferase